MNWQVEWTDPTIGDLAHHDSFMSSNAALDYADAKLKGGCHIIKVNGPNGEKWNENHVRVAIAESRAAFAAAK